MDYETAVAAIRKHFKDEWGSLTPVTVEDDVAFEIPNGLPWVRLVVQHGMGYQATLGSPGSNQFRREGLVTAMIFTPKGDGGYDARLKAQAATDVFQRPRVNGIAFENVTMNEVGNKPDGWYHVNVKAEFEYDTFA